MQPNLRTYVRGGALPTPGSWGEGKCINEIQRTLEDKHTGYHLCGLPNILIPRGLAVRSQHFEIWNLQWVIFHWHLDSFIRFI